MKQINPTLDLEMLRRIGNGNRIVLILEAPDPSWKLQIGLAALRARYATDVVLGSRLAAQIVHATK
jgi:hypothetical protein